jgi:hypothetical protein
VVLEDDAFFSGEKMSDIYVKGYADVLSLTCEYPGGGGGLSKSLLEKMNTNKRSKKFCYL